MYIVDIFWAKKILKISLNLIKKEIWILKGPKSSIKRSVMGLSPV